MGQRGVSLLEAKGRIHVLAFPAVTVTSRLVDHITATSASIGHLGPTSLLCKDLCDWAHLDSLPTSRP